MSSLPEGVRLAVWSPAKVMALWTKVSKYDILFSDETRGNVEDWTRKLLAVDSRAFEFANGMLFLQDLRPGLKANVHAVFWDYKPSKHTELVKDVMLYAFFEWDLVKLCAEVPAATRALVRFLTKRLGFQREGFLRKDFWWRGQLEDTVVLGLLREDFLDG